MVGGMVWALSQNKVWKKLSVGELLVDQQRYEWGTQLFKLEDAKRLFEWLKNKQTKNLTILHRQVFYVFFNSGLGFNRSISTPP
jgi:hypothetical protein